MKSFFSSFFRSLLVVWGVVTLVFFLFKWSNNDPIRNLLGENVSKEVLELNQRKWNLDKSISWQYLYFLNELSPIGAISKQPNSRIYYPNFKEECFVVADLTSMMIVVKFPSFGRSYVSEKEVTEILGEVFPGTLVLAFLSILIALIVGIILGVVCAVRQDTWVDRLILFFSSIGMSAPSFFVAVLLAWLFAVQWHDEVLILGMHFPGTGLPLSGSLYEMDPFDGLSISVRNLILPLMTLTIRPLGVFVQLIRSSVLEVSSMDFIRTAKSKGLSEKRIMFKHVLPNAINPVLTAVSGWFASLLAGAVFVEFVFGWKGLGQTMFQAIEKQDLPVVSGGVIFISVLFVVISIFMERMYSFLDPRIR